MTVDCKDYERGPYYLQQPTPVPRPRLFLHLKTGRELTETMPWIWLDHEQDSQGGCLKIALDSRAVLTHL